MGHNRTRALQQKYRRDPFTPGSSTDILARLIGQWLSERLGQQFVIENRPGGGSNVGTEAARAPADGYTVLLAGAQQVINAALYERLSFNFIRDIVPIVGVTRLPLSGFKPVGSSHHSARVHRLRQGESGTSSTWHLPGPEPRPTSLASCSRR